MESNRLKWGWKPHDDPRDKKYPMSLALYDGIERDLPASIIWDLGPILDQGQSQKCTAYAWKQWQQTTPLQTLDGPSPDDIYKAIKILDGHPEEEGSSTNFGVQAMIQEGRVQTYLWAFDMNTFKNFILSTGPIVVGAAWYNDMYTPDINSYVTPTGKLAGGHEFMCYGYDVTKDSFKFVNSWGSAWGDNGTFWMKASDTQKLIFDSPELPGDAAAAVEQKINPISPGTPIT